MWSKVRLALGAFSLVVGGVGCGIIPAGTVELQSPDGGSLDGVWAVGSTLDISASTSGVAIPQVVLEGDAVFENAGPFWGGVGSTKILEPGAFTIKAVGIGGNELSSVSTSAEFPAAFRLGYAYNDEPRVNFAFPDPLVVVQDGYAPIGLTGVDASGTPLRGWFPVTDYTYTGGLDVWGWRDHKVDLQPYSSGDDGSITIYDEEGSPRTFSITIVPRSAIVALEIMELPHGRDAWSEDPIVFAVGRTVDGTAVFGLDVEWNGQDWANGTDRVSEWRDEPTTACFNGICGQYAGEVWPESPAGEAWAGRQ